MSKKQRLFQVFIALALIAGLLAPAAFAVDKTPPRMSASLAELVAGDPDGTLRVIVQKADATGQAERLVQRWGGQVLKDLHIINAFAAEMPAKSLPRLASMAAVNWVALDAPMVPASTTLSARDETIPHKTRSPTGNSLIVLTRFPRMGGCRVHASRPIGAGGAASSSPRQCARWRSASRAQMSVRRRRPGRGGGREWLRCRCRRR